MKNSFKAKFLCFRDALLFAFMRQLLYTEKIGRKIEKGLEKKYLPASVIKRKSFGFDIALVTA